MRQVTSASNLHRRKSCPGSQNLEAGLPEVASDDSNEGIMLHNALTGESMFPLTTDQEYCVKFCLQQEAELSKTVFLGATSINVREVSLGFNGIEDFGHADFVACNKLSNSALVIDWKFGRIPVDSAEANMQLRAYAVMVSETFGVDNVFAAIVQPRVELEKRVTISSYGKADIAKAKEEILKILAACNFIPAELNPSEDACRYCKAKATCPALVKEADAIQITDKSALTANNAAMIYRKCKIVEKHLDSLKQTVFLMVKNAEAENRSIPGLRLKAGSKKRVVNDATKAFNALTTIMSPQDFSGCCTVKIGELEKVFKDKSCLKPREAKEKMDAMLTEAGALELKQGESSLEIIEE